MNPWRKGGTQDLQMWALGERVISIATLKVGDIVLNDSAQFDAHNLCRILRFDDPAQFKPPRDICYAIYVDPNDVSKPRRQDDAELAIWGHELTGTLNAYYRVQIKFVGTPDASPPPLVIQPVFPPLPDLKLLRGSLREKAPSKYDWHLLSPAI